MKQQRNLAILAIWIGITITTTQSALAGPIEDMKKALEALQCSLNQANDECARTEQRLNVLKQTEEQRIREIDAACAQKQQCWENEFAATNQRRQQEWDMRFNGDCEGKRKQWEEDFGRDCDRRQRRFEEDARGFNQRFEGMYPRFEYKTFDHFRSQEMFKYNLSSYIRSQMATTPGIQSLVLQITLLDENNGIAKLKFEVYGREIVPTPFILNLDRYGNFDETLLAPLINVLQREMTPPGRGGNQPPPRWGGGHPGWRH